MWPNPQETAYLVTVTEEILSGKPYFFVQWFFDWKQTKNTTTTFDFYGEKNRNLLIKNKLII